MPVNCVKTYSKNTYPNKGCVHRYVFTLYSIYQLFSLTLKANVLPADADERSVKWSSSDENIAKVNAEGVITAVAKNRWINATNMDAQIVITACPADYVKLDQTKPENIELLTVEEAILSCL